ncbi:uncharacterized protein A1O9_06562 [Exophiala aquamarina CBS 119918]|uniref:Glyoxalase-like domain-containing protein n=1 Tax=Exophiala aquamarina CBS 119918 TaxID=1182545 RepID=A0A072PFI7_9EURO|nr:uncharacterized protein A1O9_06562 [Exophiala aquamarina CBS 119918]KEF58636.1 hypothetical protein A1O9_06562 [Exophiala aquamarina CBS 119918]
MSKAPYEHYAHDHVILMLDTPEFENLPTWLTDNFNIIEGGTHAGGSTRNKLIIFADGTYIELLNWIAKPVEFFDWAGKAPGLIDFALTSTQSAHEVFDAVMKRLESSSSSSSFGDGGLGVRFKDPLNGGRKRKDGKQVEWYVTKPRFDSDDDGAPNVPRPQESYFPMGRLDTPFFCHDVTDRALRVPYLEPGIADHPSGAKGILSVEVVVPQNKLESYAKLYASATGSEPEAAKNDATTAVRLRLASPDPEALKEVQDRVGIDLRMPADEADEQWIRERGVGIRALKIYVPGLSKDRPLDGTGIGSSVVLVS